MVSQRLQRTLCPPSSLPKALEPLPLPAPTGSGRHSAPRPPSLSRGAQSCSPPALVPRTLLREELQSAATPSLGPCRPRKERFPGAEGIVSLPVFWKRRAPISPTPKNPALTGNGPVARAPWAKSPPVAQDSSKPPSPSWRGAAPGGSRPPSGTQAGFSVCRPQGQWEGRLRTRPGESLRAAAETDGRRSHGISRVRPRPVGKASDAKTQKPWPPAATEA